VTSAAEAFYARGRIRIVRWMLAFGIVAPLTAAFIFSWFVAGGVALGCAVAGLNFYWLERVIEGFSRRIAQPEQSGRSPRLAVRFFLRYAIIGAAAYVILTSSLVSLGGFFTGLFLPVPAIMAEAIHETFAALRRGY
jgi:hypothetical protein